MEIFYFPLVHHGDITLSQEEMDFFEAIKYNDNQNRMKFIVNATLNDVAHDYACQMANENFFSHTDPRGIASNQRVINSGHTLPSHYEVKGNNVESIAAGYSTVASVVQGLFESPEHLKHLSGSNDFFLKQTQIGVGYCFKDDSNFGHYWVFLSTP